ncbi:pyridoxal phosphate-dependent decarboxylase family protein [Rhodohalobacter sp. 614A]|uniref:pyridoxal phosphate-dependent decarboxylase family protein n=1 Tax=Rhodohalobacter sp. 614A TaxID=2908649 RepID=UPI001F3CC5AF|nr:aminotransferase class V-fold PLP-dependent enzyme [Rhodohalobacter sp. 614A]
MNQFEPYLPILEEALQKLDSWRVSYGKDTGSISDAQFEQIQKIADRLTVRLEGNYPFHHPGYAGQMLKPPHPVAWLSYALAMTINPNNHALDGGPPTSEMEKEVIQKMAAMIGYDSNSLGHLTSGGTIANLEALFIAREIHPKKAVAASANAHYTHQRMCHVLNCEFIKIPADHFGIPDIDFIKNNADQIGTIVVTLGTTGLGIVEPLQEILKVAKNNHIRVHADAAYGGFFKLISDELPSRRHWDYLSECDSIVIDPHKHGLQPYGCGSVLYKDAAVGKYFKHDSPYTYFTSDDLHLGEISLECSRAGASAAAFWSTLEFLPLTKSGLGSILASTINAANKFASRIKEESKWQLYRNPDLDIVAYFKEPNEKSILRLNQISHEIFDRGMNLGTSGYHLSLFKVPADEFLENFPDYQPNAEHAVILRSVFMKEEHEDFVDELVQRLTS